MFEHLDTVIAFAMVMLLLSLLVTAAVQMVVAVFGLRGRNLTWGVKMLLAELDPGLAQKATDAEGKVSEGARDLAQDLARKVLSYPVISTTTNRLLQFIDWAAGLAGKGPYFNNGKRAPTAVRPKEILLVLDRLRDDPSLDKGLRERVGKLLDAEDFRTLLPTGPTKVLPKKVQTDIEQWFDVVMDATTERFKLHARWITVAAAGLLAFGFQIDSGDIYKRLGADPELRAAIVAQAVGVDSLYQQVYRSMASDSVPADTATQASPSATDPARAEVERAGRVLEQVVDELEAADVVDLQWKGWTDPRENWGGKLATALLLSLGAPFWYGLLQKLVGFRSAVARRREQESS